MITAPGDGFGRSRRELTGFKIAPRQDNGYFASDAGLLDLIYRHTDAWPYLVQASFHALKLYKRIAYRLTLGFRFITQAALLLLGSIAGESIVTAQTLYGTLSTGAFPDGVQEVVRLNTSTGATTPVGILDIEGQSIGFGIDGPTAYDPVTHTYFAYTASCNGNTCILSLSSVNTTTGKRFSIPVGGPFDGRGALPPIPRYLQFDSNSASLYGTLSTGAFPDGVQEVVRINTSTGATTPVGILDIEDHPIGFGIYGPTAYDPVTHTYFAYTASCNGNTCILSLSSVNTTTGKRFSIPVGGLFDRRGATPAIPNYLHVSSSIDVLDPVPTLVTKNGVTTDETSLVNATNTVTGVAADGATRVVLRIPAPNPNEEVSIQVQDEEKNSADTTDSYGGLRPLGNQTAAAQLSLRVNQSGDSPYVFVLYQAPADFARPGIVDDLVASRLAHFQITNSQGTESIPFLVYRPPIALVHGLWSSAGAWDDFTALTDNPAFSASVYLVDYSNTSGNAFSVNWWRVAERILDVLADYRMKNNIAATQVDVVAHSMGGVLTRDYASQPIFRGNGDFNSGRVHKLITIDSPHRGSEFPGKIAASSAVCQKVFGALGKDVSGAVADLTVDSPALTALNSPVPLGFAVDKTPIKGFAIAGVTSPGQALLTELSVVHTTVLPKVCLALSIPFATLFNSPSNPDGASDLVVAKASQLGYENGTSIFQGSPATQEFPGFVHATAAGAYPYGPSVLGQAADQSAPGSAVDPLQVANYVVTLLNTPITQTSSPSFGAMIP